MGESSGVRPVQLYRRGRVGLGDGFQTTEPKFEPHERPRPAMA